MIIVYSLYFLWILYLAIMSLAKAKKEGTLSKPATYLAYPILAIGYLIDCLVNIVIMTIILLELPKEMLVTSRVTRHKFKSVGWRKRIAVAICKHLLDPFDPSGCHCKE